MSRPLRFDVRNLVAQGHRMFKKRVSGIQIRLPGLTFTVQPTDPEVKVARQIVVWLADRRVLKATECCDNCITRSLESLRKIREHLVERQVELADHSDGPLFLLLEFIVQGLRQFLTYEEHLRAEFGDEVRVQPSHSIRPDLLREHYFAALEILRAHIGAAAHQIALIAGISLPSVPENLRIQTWSEPNYVTA
jgi:hypothetical protein